jgi:hypothetical protein
VAAAVSAGDEAGPSNAEYVDAEPGYEQDQVAGAGAEAAGVMPAVGGSSGSKVVDEQPKAPPTTARKRRWAAKARWGY